MSSVICLDSIFNIKVRILSSTSKYILKNYYLGDPYVHCKSKNDLTGLFFF